MKLHLDKCSPTLRERIERQMSVEDAVKQPVFSHTEGSGSDLNDTCGVLTPPKPKNRIRQSQKPMNKLEQAFYDWKRRELQDEGCRFYPHGLSFALCNGVKYTPDLIVVNIVGQIFCYEVKGPQQIQDDASVKLKVAAKEWPHFSWCLVWRDKVAGWQHQRIIP